MSNADMSNADMSNADQFDFIDTLQAALANGTLSLGQHAKLQRLVCDVPEARRCYIRLVHQHATLLRLLAAKGEVADTHAARAIGVPTEDNTTPANMPVLGFLGGTARWTRDYFSQPGPFSMLAATIFMVCVILILEILPTPTYTPIHIGSNSTTNSPGRQPRDKDGKFNFVARITGKHNCRWATEGRAPLSYNHLAIGHELKLDSGLVEITYKTGVKVVLEGPVEYTFKKANTGRLDLGKFTAKVSKPAIGFTINTPGMSIVDLGTEFGAQVDKSGTTEAHVFAGVIEAHMIPRGAKTAVKILRLGKNQAIRLNAATGKISTLGTGYYQFVRAIRPENPVPIRVATVHFGRLEIFRGPDGLDLSGDIVWALNVGGVSNQTVRGVTFLSNANGQNAGAMLSASQIIHDPWGIRPEYGDTTDDDALESVMRSIFWDNASAAVIGLPVSQGRYKVQLLFSENYWAGGNAENRRGQNIQIEGEQAVKNLVLPYEQGSEKPDITSGIVYTHTLSVTDGRLDIVLPYQDGGVPNLFNDGNPILNGLTVERVSDPESPLQQPTTQPSIKPRRIRHAMRKPAASVTLSVENENRPSKVRDLNGCIGTGNGNGTV